MTRLAMAATAFTLVLAGCAPADPNPSSTPGQDAPIDLLSDFGLAEMDAVEAIDHLDRLAVTDRPADLMASVYPDELVLTDNVREVTLDIPEDSSYLSIAPYVDQTHDCFYHSLTTCLGELSNENIELQIVDNATGEEIIDEEMTTFDNGFIGVWVPNNIADGTIEITYDGLTGSTDFTTTDEGATCITDLRVE